MSAPTLMQLRSDIANRAWGGTDGYKYLPLLDALLAAPAPSAPHMMTTAERREYLARVADGAAPSAPDVLTEPRRYSLGLNLRTRDHEMVRVPVGTYVFYSDYARLVDEVRRLTERERIWLEKYDAVRQELMHYVEQPVAEPAASTEEERRYLEAEKHRPASDAPAAITITRCGSEGCTLPLHHGGLWHDDGKSCWRAITVQATEQEAPAAITDTMRLHWLFAELHDEAIGEKIRRVGNNYSMRAGGCRTWREAIDVTIEQDAARTAGERTEPK